MRDAVLTLKPLPDEAGSILRPADSARAERAGQTHARPLTAHGPVTAAFHRELTRLLKLHIPEGSRVLQVGCRMTTLLDDVRAAEGVGVDWREMLVSEARRRAPRYEYLSCQPHELPVKGPFDIIVLADVLGELTDVQTCLQAVREVCSPSTRVLLTTYNALWEPVLKLASAIGLRRPAGEENWLTSTDVDNLLMLSGFEPLKRTRELLLPARCPVLSALCNRILARLWPTRGLALVDLVIARPRPEPRDARRLTCSVIVPTRNERGNIEHVVRRTPDMGAQTELIFVDGDSTDGTADEIERVIRANPHRNIRLIRQGDGRGKGDAVRKGFAAACGDVFMILDADLTVPPEDLPKFFECLASGQAEFVNGTRLVYPMQRDAMRLLNKMANAFFSRLFTWLLDQRFRDTLCGTKALWRRDYERIAAGRGDFGDLDPFGDFDLIFGAARANLKIIEIPIRYRARTYGVSNIRRFLHGLLLLRMSWVGLWTLKLR